MGSRENWIEANPCDGLKPPTKEKARDRVLSDDEIRWFWLATEELGWPFGHLFRVLLLTAQRRDEVATMNGPNSISTVGCEEPAAQG